MKNNLSIERIADTDYGAVRVETILFHKHTKEKDIYQKQEKSHIRIRPRKGKSD